MNFSNHADETEAAGEFFAKGNASIPTEMATKQRYSQLKLTLESLNVTLLTQGKCLQLSNLTNLSQHDEIIKPNLLICL